jgi:hypothetical protein
VIEAFVFTTPDLFGGELAAFFAELEGTRADAVAGGAIHDVFKHDR